MDDLTHSHATTTLVNVDASCVCPTKIEGYERPENEVIDILHGSQYLLGMYHEGTSFMWE